MGVNCTEHTDLRDEGHVGKLFCTDKQTCTCAWHVSSKNSTNNLTLLLCNTGLKMFKNIKQKKHVIPSTFKFA